MPAKKIKSVPAPASEEITINKDQAKLLVELLDRLKPNDSLSQREWNDIAMKIGTQSAKAAKERLRYLTCVLSNRPTKASRAKPGQVVDTTITPSSKTSTQARPTTPAARRHQNAQQGTPRKRKNPPMNQSTFDAGPASKRTRTIASPPAAPRAVAKIEEAQYEDDEEEEEEAEEAEEVEDRPLTDFAQLVRQRQIPVESESFSYPSSSLPHFDMQVPSLDVSSLDHYYGGGAYDEWGPDYDMAAVQKFFG